MKKGVCTGTGEGEGEQQGKSPQEVMTELRFEEGLE